MTTERTYDFVVVSNRLPVDRVVPATGEAFWQHSPGGLVTALEPVMRASKGAWVGWAGQPDLEFEPFSSDGLEIIRQIKADPTLAAVPCMLVTNYAEHQEVAVAIGAELGFGKSEYREPETRAKLARFLE